MASYADAQHPHSPYPLAGVRVLDFSWVWAGPYAGMLLACLGADVIKIEGWKRSDLMRRAVVWPLPEPAPTRVLPNQGMMFNSVNQNKRSLCLDLGTEKGRRLARRLAAHADVVLDNLRPGAMEKLGLGYDDLQKIRPDIIMASSSRCGLQGPESRYLGFATIHHAVGGGTYLTGYPDDHPSHGSAGDVDLMNAMQTAFAILAALNARGAAGQGQFIDFSQCEGVSSIIGEALLGYFMTGAVPERSGNAHPVCAPHAVFRCWGVDRWLALEVHDDEQFAALADCMARPELAADPRYRTMAARKAHEESLNALIEDWTRNRDRDWLAAALTAAGLAAAPVRDARDVYADPHMKARGAFVTIAHPELGDLRLVGPPWKMSGPAVAPRCAPLLGEHSREVLTEIAGLTAAEIDALIDEGVVQALWPADTYLL